MHHATSVLATTATWLIAAIAETVHLTGDSTMVATGNNDGTEGWGAFLPNYTSLAVSNEAIAGQSARSFTREGRFAAVVATIKQGDYVVIEFGHNDGGSLSPTDNGRTDCNPNDAAGYAATCQTTYNGVSETVLTYYAYLVNAAKLFQSKGASVIISSATPDNVWEGGSYSYSPSRFVAYARDAATDSGSTFVDHQNYTAALYKDLGYATVNAFYPHDHTHTSPAGANVVANAFILGLNATDSTMKKYITQD
ncbi:carbohydrate esterase family 12 protein [Dothistroma septosporum NZE10]|uniref:Carbohydrate esterase family 12 protein n=1 Tax=Dothistroma septosporum (strain NZE10 / CBS 128990) TaxID=675120 RepID=N1PFE1_DOTSN|nr:carbohydrate esterase family 12 protein [Dothistroma septosporum NZE10]